MTVPQSAVDLRLDPDQSVVIVIDVQNDFCHPDGVQGQRGRDVGRASASVERLLPFLDGARRAGVPIVFVQTVHGPATDSAAWLARNCGELRSQSCLPGTWGAELYGVDPEPDEILLTKHRYSVFVGTEIEAVLTTMGRSSLLFTGVSTPTCVESSLRDAVSRDYLATLVEDCCGAYSQTAHQRAIDGVAAGFGLVASGQQILDHWGQRADTGRLGQEPR